jgi:tetratricopeptide (TPR) repeat protein
MAGVKPQALRPSILFALLMLALMGVVVACYQGPLTGESFFILDDESNITNNYNLRITELSFESLSKAARFKGQFIRPVPFVSFALDYYRGGLDARNFRATNVAILVLTGWGVALMGYLLFGRWLPARGAFAAAAIAGAVWVLHPLQTNITVYVVQRMTSLAVLGYVWALVCVLLAERKSALWWLGAVAFFLVGVLSKEIVWALPFAVLLYKLSSDEALYSRVTSRRWLMPLALVALAGAWLIIALVWKGHLYELRDFNAWERFLTQARVLWHYAGLFFLPLPSSLNLDYDYALSTGLFSPAITFVALAGHVILLALASWCWKKGERLGALLVFLYYLHHIMESSLIGLELVFEHRMALPGVYLSLLVGYVVVRATGKLGVPKGAVAQAVALLLIGGLLAVSTGARNRVWASATSILEDNARKSPRKSRVTYNLGKQYFFNGNMEGAKALFSQTYQSNPDHWQSHFGLGAILEREGHYRQALPIFKKLKADGHNDTSVNYRLGLCYQGLGRYTEALNAYYLVLKANATMKGVNYQIAAVYDKTGNRRQAVNYARKELGLDSSHKGANALLKRLLSTQEKRN